MNTLIIVVFIALGVCIGVWTLTFGVEQEYDNDDDASP